MSPEQVRSDAAQAGPDECGCGPSPAEARALWPQMAMSRRSALTAGVLGVAALGAFGLTSGVSAAHAATYPSWDDVEKARANEAAKAREITRIEGLISALAYRVQEANAAAERAANEYYEAQQAFFEAAEQATQLQEQADAQAGIAEDSARKAGQVASQLYRNGGDDASLELFFAGSAAGADDLLARLGQMDKLLEHNQSIYDTAVAARNSAQQLSDQAAVARDERDRLQRIAEEKLVEAQRAAEAAQAALDEQTAYLGTLEAQLAALKDDTAKTIAAYKEGVAERKRREEARRKAEEERRRKEAEEAARRAEEAAKNNNGGGGGSSGGGSGGGSGGAGGQVGGSGWARPHGGYISSWFGPRTSKCTNGYCSSSNHRGIDFANGCGAYIYAAASGTVDAAFYNGGYGNYIRIQHGGGIATGYAHIRPGGYLVGHGQQVSAGQRIAYAGDTGNSFGCHLHFEVYVNGATVNPATFLRGRGVSV